VNETILFDAGVGGAIVGGVLLGLLGFIYQIAMRARMPDGEPAENERAAFTDARIIACISLVPQLCLMSLPVIYRHPHDVPYALGPAAVFVATMLVCTWIWMALKVLKAGSRRCWFSAWNLIIFSAPGLIPALAFGSLRL